MNKREIVRFFRILAKIYHEPCTLILTGAGAGAVYGQVRATLDLDFALRFKTPSPRKKEKMWRKFEACVHEVSLRTGIAAQYAEDIDRWSMISYLDYERHTLPFLRIGTINLRVLDPRYWAIGKLARYLDPDIRDLIRVFQKTRINYQNLAKVLGRALKASPRSTARELFKRQVEDFFETYGGKIWGRKFKIKESLRAFYLSGVRP